MKVIALIGKSGTGKSYNALKITKDYEIEYLIDDGILIYKNKILAGISAKKSKTKMDAVRRAIFEDDKHRDSVLNEIKSRNVDKLLIIGTSKKMIDKIANRLEIKKLFKIIYIEEISSLEDINKAKEIRRTKGSHVVPIPSFEVKKHFSGIFRNPIKMFFKNKNEEVVEVEKTIVRPNFSYLGKYYISQKAVKQIVKYELSKENLIYKLLKIQINKNSNCVDLSIELELVYDKNFSINKVRKIQMNINDILEKMTLININSINIDIVKINTNNR